jgi:hypothetical protein
MNKFRAWFNDDRPLTKGDVRSFIYIVFWLGFSLVMFVCAFAPFFSKGKP